MNTEAIDIAFAKLVNTKGIHKTLGITSGYIRTLRHKLNNGLGISFEKKLELLTLFGWKQNDLQFSRTDLVNAIRFTLNSNKAAKDLGAEYLLEKFLSSPR